MNRTFFLALTLAVAFIGACSATTGNAGDASVDSSADASVDVAADTAACEGLSRPVCFRTYGAGGTCDDSLLPGVDTSPLCTSAGWRCREGQIPMEQCRCGVPPSCPADAGRNAADGG